MRDVDALDAMRRARQAQSDPHLLEPALHILRRASPFVERVFGVVRGELQQAHAGPALRDAQRHAATTALAQHLSQTLGGFDLHGDEHLVRGRGALVVLIEEGRHQLLVRQGHASQLVRVDTRESSFAHAQHHHLRLVGLSEEAEHVLIDVAHAAHVLLFAQQRDGAELITQARRLFVFERGRGLAHALPELARELVVTTREQEGDPSHLRSVRLGRDGQDAGRGAAPDLVLQTRTRAALELAIRAGAELEVAVDQLERFARAAGRGVGPEVAGAVGVGSAHDAQARPLLLRIEAQRKVVLVVAELDVVARSMALDELALEQRRLLLRGRHEGLDVRELRLEAIDEGARIVAPRGEVAAHAALQVRRLADVQDLFVRSTEEVDARRDGQGLELLADALGEHASD